MKQYNIYAKPQGNYEAVKLGWSWPAFFFSWIWAMVKKMWVLGVGVLIVEVVIMTVMPEIDSILDIFWTIISLVINFTFGIYGNNWREINLPKRGYEHKGTVTAANPEGAIALHIKENTENKHQ